jgi:hypothetical protein
MDNLDDLLIENSFNKVFAKGENFNECSSSVLSPPDLLGDPMDAGLRFAASRSPMESPPVVPT